MSATTFKNLIQRREHKERSQPAARQHMGILEKHGDYVRRATNYHDKEKRILALRRKAAFRNPDEFYHKMSKSETKGGVHKGVSVRPILTADELKLLKTQDRSYLQTMASVEEKKIEKLKASLHGISKLEAGASGGRTHTLFVDSAAELETFQPSEYFDTDPAHMSLAHNRLKRKRPEEVTDAAPRAGAGAVAPLAKPLDPRAAKRARKETDLAYAELEEREARAEKMTKLVKQIDLERELLKKGRRVKVADASGSTAAVFMWKPQRRK